MAGLRMLQAIEVDLAALGAGFGKQPQQLKPLVLRDVSGVQIDLVCFLSITHDL
jgi:hypothetical protein